MIPSWVIDLIGCSAAKPTNVDESRRFFDDLKVCVRKECRGLVESAGTLNAFRAGLTSCSDEAATILNSIMPFQKEGIDYGIRNGGRVLLGDEMGLGKTLQAIAIAYQYKSEWPLLIVCPASLTSVWFDQLMKWTTRHMISEESTTVIASTDQVRKGQANIHTAQVVIVSYSLFTNTKEAGLLDKATFRVVIADECHALKDHSSKRCKTLLPVLKSALRVILVSGTPVLNEAEEVFPLLSALAPKLPVTLTSYRQRYCLRRLLYFKGVPVEKWYGVRNGEELNSLLLCSFMIRRKKVDVLKQLPPLVRHRVNIYPTSKDLASISGLKELVDRQTGKGAQAGIIELWRKTGEAKLDFAKEYCGTIALNVAEGAPDGKVLIFAHHVFIVEGLTQHLNTVLKSSGRRCIRIDGSVSAPMRAELVEEFQTKPDVAAAVLSVTACGEGLTLTKASTVIFAELYWVPGVMEQAEARAHRVGQTSGSVVVHYLVLAGSPDETVYSLVEKKKEYTGLISDGVSGKSSLVNFVGSVNTAEKQTTSQPSQKMIPSEKPVVRHPLPESSFKPVVGSGSQVSSSSIDDLDDALLDEILDIIDPIEP